MRQYVLAVDRGNDMVADLYHEIHPAVLRLIKTTIEAGKARGIPVALCGEMGSKSAFVPLLIGLGLEEISASPAYLPEVKRVIRALTRSEAVELAERALKAPDALSAGEVLNDWLEAHPLDLMHFLERNNAAQNDRGA
jgi:phosphotransferase system enzyme I (PtsI)